MIYLLCALCASLFVIICILLVKIILLRKATDEIRTEFAAKLATDTNTGIDVTTSDRKMRQLAADIDLQLQLLRKEHIRYYQGDRELKDAITNISHDLRTPLTAICGYMELLQREDSSDTVRKYLDIIANRIEALKQLTEELFRYSVMVSVNHYDSREAVSLNKALEESIAAYYGALKEKGIIPDISMPEERIARQLNKAALSRILSNVISNAVKYSDGDLKICLSEQGVITFSNHAKQLNEVLVGRLFDRFYTVENGQNSTGLGLSIARVLTEQMGGKISASYKSGQLYIVISME
ncbi:MAG: sensor histidine kinase [Eubacterium sp.]|jgi:signal transduction histidine kinase|nr:sensor histidine kinase [Eubacterium sp.]